MALPFPSPTSLSPGFTMSRATTDDIDTISELYYETFKPDHGNSFWWPADKTAMLEWLKRRVTGKMNDRGVRHFKIIDAATGHLVAFARWDVPQHYEASFGDWIGDEMGGEIDVSKFVESDGIAGAEIGAGVEKPVTSAPIEGPRAVIDFPDGSDPVLCHQYWDAIAKASAKWYTKDMLGLSLLATASRYHRRGAATALMLPMLAIADALELKSYLESTASGRPVYEKLGFRVVDKLHDGHLSVMIRDPKPL
ncbi:Uu.00g105960.m01.CDS01 [Anthostomella pinea]|uniref:Uu.00g105960.m01.CDS01 n=1 Tax=Anthostomella pinea TaxID=933095 RepID=A0AAI8VF24_9PEZI|nr:Uu.00g105960.m01.CDS01 [Anthostomella pinea]